MNSSKNINWTVDDVIKATHGVLSTGSRTTQIKGFSTDSRKISPDQCFICLKGEVHDAHQYIPDVIGGGTKAIIADNEKLSPELLAMMTEQAVDCIGVDDTLTALGDIAAYQRHRSGISVVALTGSNGKTTTRTMTTHVLGRRYSVLSPFGNFNNLIGVPLTLLRIDQHHEWAVLELGMNRPGEILRLGQISRPDVGLITNIGPAHLEGLGSLEGVMNAKGEILETISPGGKVILNTDDALVMRLAKRTNHDTVLFGLSVDAHIRASQVENKPNGVVFRLDTPVGQTQMELRVAGSHSVSNALAAAAVGYCLDIPLEEIQSALTSFVPVKGRMNILETTSGCHLIDDTYNANPASVKAALQTLTALRQSDRGIAVLGDMLELGTSSADLHTEIGRFAAESGVSKLYITGDFCSAVKKGAIEGGLPSANIMCGSKNDLMAALKPIIEPEDWILIKGSRGMKMETLVQVLQSELGIKEGKA